MSYGFDSRTATALVAGASFGLTAPGPVHAALSEAWSTTANVLASGELDGSPELELVVGGATNILVVDAATGATEHTFDAAWSPGASPAVWIADTDVDGRGEIIITLFAAPRLGLFDFDGGTFVERWAHPALAPPTLVTSNVVGDAARELVIDPGPLLVLDAFTGQKVYDSDMSIGGPVIDYDVGDWDGDGIDDILATFQGAPNLYLISDANPLDVGGGAIDGAAARLRATPNPSSGGVGLQFALDAPGHVRLRVYDLAGRLVTTLHDAPLYAGTHRLMWDGTDRRGRAVAPGVYHYEVETPAGRAARRMIRLR